MLSDARCFFYWAKDRGDCIGSPVPRRLLHRIQERPPNRLTDEEVDLLLTKLDGELLWTIRLALETGMRWGELARLQSSDVNRRSGYITVHQTKSGRMRGIPVELLPADLRAELMNRVGKLIPYSVRSSGTVARAVRKATGISGFHVHRLRHRFACRFLERDGGLEPLQLLLGHADMKTTQRYGRLSDEVVREAAKKVGWGSKLGSEEEFAARKSLGPRSSGG